MMAKSKGKTSNRDEKAAANSQTQVDDTAATFTGSASSKWQTQAQNTPAPTFPRRSHGGANKPPSPNAKIVSSGHMSRAAERQAFDVGEPGSTGSPDYDA